MSAFHQASIARGGLSFEVGGKWIAVCGVLSRRISSYNWIL